MRKEPEDLLMLRLSAMYLEGGYLYEADELFYHHAKDVEYGVLKAKEKLNYLKAMYTWSSKINSEQARHLVGASSLSLKNPFELHYYILILRKKLLYPLLIFTWFFV